jgi:hypothetical protein
MLRLHRDERGQSLVIVLSLITIMFLLGSSLAVHGSVALRSTRTSDAQGDDFYAADAATELGIWWQRNGKAGNPPAQTINGVTTSTTITTAGGGGGCPSAPAPIWLTGFEHGAVSSNGGGLFNGVIDIGGPNATAPASAARSGGYGLRIQTADPLDFAYVTKNTTGVDLLVARLSIQLPTLPPADADLALFNASTGGDLWITYKGSSQKLALRIGTGTPVEMSGAFSAATWYSFDIRYYVGTNPRTAEWQVNGVAQTDVTSTETAAASVSSVQLGADSGTISDMYFDDVMISSTSADYPIGDVTITRLLPNGMGTSSGATNFENNDGTAIDANSYTRLDDVPINSTADYIAQLTNAGTAHIELTFADTTETCIRGASGVVAYHGAANQANNGETRVFAGWQTYLQSGAMNGSALKYASGIISTGGASWTEALLNGVFARIGYSTDATPDPYWDAVMLEVAYRPAGGPATITVVGTGGGSTVTTDYTDAGAGVPTLDTWTVTR